MLTKK
jgi:uncharacterized protein (UPF0335 family)